MIPGSVCPQEEPVVIHLFINSFAGRRERRAISLIMYHAKEAADSHEQVLGRKEGSGGRSLEGTVETSVISSKGLYKRARPFLPSSEAEFWWDSVHM